MSHWIEEFENHAIHETLRVNLEIISKVEAEVDLDEEDIEYLERVKQINARLKKALAGVDPVTTPQAPLENINSSLQSQTNQLKSFINNSVATYLQQANSHADSIQLQLAALPFPRDLGDLEGVREGISSFRRSVAQHIRNVAEDADEFKTKVNELEKRAQEATALLEGQKKRVDDAVNEFQAQFSQAEATRTEQFSRAEEARRTEHSNQLTGQKDTVERVLAEFARNRKVAEKEFTDESNQLLQTINDKKTQAESLVHVIGNTGMVGGYQKIADAEKDTARNWERIAMGAMVLLVGMGFYIFLLTTKEGFSWSLLGSRVVVTIPLGVIAAYAAHRAEKHREAERRNRRMELELASINPYLAKLPDDEQNRIVALLAERFFAQNESLPQPLSDGKADSQTPVQVLNSAVDVIKSAVENLTKK